MNQEHIKRFEDLLLSVDRKGIDKLIDFIRKSDFYTAPASTKYHLCHEGGLLEHSLNVYDCLLAKADNEIWKPIMSEIDRETLILTALLHDLCKANYYSVEYRNQKVYSEYGTKSDNKGRFDWESVPFYIVDDKYPYGHGEKSVMMADSFITLKPIEKYAIRWHMGFTEPKENWNYLTKSIQLYPLVMAIHEADLEATYLLEKEE